MKLAVIGSRSINDYILVRNILMKIDGIDEIVSGGADGVDSLAKLYAHNNNIKLTVFYPDWGKYGRSAGYKRNRQIVDYADRVLAFWDGESVGTTHSFKLAKDMGKPIEIIKVIQ